MTIPACVHFCWIGPRLPWAYVFAILSAAERSEMQEVILHHTDPLEDGPQLRALQSAAVVTLAKIEPLDCLALPAAELGLGTKLADLYQRLASPVMRSDVLRVAILYAYGGIYLDLDTITVASLLPLLNMPAFISSEFVVWPHFVLQSRSPALWARVLTLDLVRKLMRILPGGWKVFRRLEHFYFRAANNAVMGSEPKSSLLQAYLQAMVLLPADRQTQPYALGPELLQDVVEHMAGVGFAVQEPSVFFPLGPEISEHWFRNNAVAPLQQVLLPETRVVHWYASVRGRSRVARISPDYVKQHRDHQLYSALVCANIRQLPAAS
jgi:hypothetical protein